MNICSEFTQRIECKTLDSCLTYLTRIVGPQLISRLQEGKQVPVGWVKSIHSTTQISDRIMKYFALAFGLVGTAVIFTAILLCRYKRTYFAIASFIVGGYLLSQSLLGHFVIRHQFLIPLTNVLNEFLQTIQNPLQPSTQTPFDFKRISELREKGIGQFNICGYEWESNLFARFAIESDERCSAVYANPTCELLNDSLHEVNKLSEDLCLCTEEILKPHLKILGATVNQFNSLKLGVTEEHNLHALFEEQNPDTLFDPEEQDLDAVLVDLGKKFACALQPLEKFNLKSYNMIYNPNKKITKILFRLGTSHILPKCLGQMSLATTAPGKWTC